SPVKESAWKLIEFLSPPAQQIEIYRLAGDLPARRSAWQQARLSEDKHFRAFHQQMAHVKPLPPVPEWERIAIELTKVAEQAIHGDIPVERALAVLDRRVDAMLEKRRWLIARQPAAAEEEVQ